jgi:hypothetical protein
MILKQALIISIGCSMVCTLLKWNMILWKANLICVLCNLVLLSVYNWSSFCTFGRIVQLYTCFCAIYCEVRFYFHMLLAHCSSFGSIYELIYLWINLPWNRRKYNEHLVSVDFYQYMQINFRCKWLNVNQATKLSPVWFACSYLAFSSVYHVLCTD